MVNRKQIWAWAFYDFANSSYALLIASFVFPIFFREVIAGPERGDFYWGLAISLSILFGGLLAPVVGAMADYDGKKKVKFISFATLSILGTAALYFTGLNTLFLALMLFILTNLCYEVSQTLYDSFLGHVSTRETVGRISGLAWGFGYLGGVVAMLAFRPLYEPGFAGELLATYKLTFPLTALFFLVFALPAFISLKDPQKDFPKESLRKRLQVGLQNTVATLKNIRNHKHIAWFLLGFYLLNDALVTMFAFMPIFARTTIGFSFSEIVILLLLVQVLAFPFAAFFGYLSDKKGPKKILLFTLMIWMVITVMLASAYSKFIFYIIAFLGAVTIGSSQAVARSWLSKLVPEEKRFEFFGFNGFATKIAAVTGPLVFGSVSTLTGNQRFAVLALLPFFIASFIIFMKVQNSETPALPDPRGI